MNFTKVLGDFVYKAWITHEASLAINYLEVLALEPAVCRWAPLWINKKVYIDANNVAAIVNNGTCHNRTVMDSFRRSFWLSAIFNFRLKCVYYPGDDNRLGDALSHLHEPSGFIRLKTAMFNCGYF